MSESGLKLLVWIIAAALMTTLLVIPQPVAPWEIPSLQLRRVDVVESRAIDDATLEKSLAPGDDRALREALFKHGRGEIVPLEGMHASEIAKMKAHEVAERVLKSDGPAALDAARVRAADAFEDAFRRRATSGENDGDPILGGFVDILVHYGALQGDTVIAPSLTLRAMYKARWNAIFGRPLAEGLVGGEPQAYWGWLALHATAAPWSLRGKALQEFRSAGGSGAAEAGAMFAVIAGRPMLAAKVLKKTHADNATIRLRNLAQGALAGAQQPGTAPRVDTQARIP